MTSDDRKLRRLQEAFTSGSGAGERSGEELERIWAALHDQADAEEVERLLDQAGSDPELAEAWMIGLEMRRAERVQVPEETSGPDGTAARWPAWLSGIAAAILIGLVGGWWLMDRPGDGPPPSPYRIEPGQRITIESLVGEAPLPRDRALLRWTPVPEQATYVLTIFKESDVVATVPGLDVPEYRLPPELLAPYPDGSTLDWHVKAFTPSGQEILSPRFSFRLGEASSGN